MNTALEIANYVIFHERQNGRTISNLRLQKLLYFIQAQFLASFKIPCFPDKMEAWTFGPVVPSVYHNFKIYGSSSIPCNDVASSVEHSELIDKLLDRCAQWSTSSLVSLSHQQEPWKKAYNNCIDNEITPGAIKKFFKCHS